MALSYVEFKNESNMDRNTMLRMYRGQSFGYIMALEHFETNFIKGVCKCNTKEEIVNLVCGNLEFAKDMADIELNELDNELNGRIENSIETLENEIKEYREQCLV